jgi:hypothetical protein
MDILVRLGRRWTGMSILQTEPNCNPRALSSLSALRFAANHDARRPHSSLNILANGRVKATFSRMILSITVSGMAKNMPIKPQH